MRKRNLLLCMLGCTLMSQAAYQGRVFVDTNRNGQYDKGEKLLKGVCISDGLHVVKTAADGSFSLPGFERERFIFITTPSGYQTDNKHYIRISDQNRSYDFGVQPLQGYVAPDGSHQYLHIADTEIFNTVNQEDWANEMRDLAANEKVAFMIHTGDICYENGLKNHIKLMNTSNMGCPVFYCLGNHDLVKGKYGEELFESIYGPVYYSFDFGSTHYIVTPMWGGDHAPGFRREDVFRWIEQDLAQQPTGKPIVFFNHDLWSTTDQFVFKLSDTEKLDLNDYNTKAWVYGHWHMHFIRQQGKIKTISTSTLDKGGIDRSVSAVRMIHADRDGNITSQLRYTYLNHSLQFASIANDACVVDAEGNLKMSVNAYHTVSPLVRLTYSCVSEGGKEILRNQPLKANTDWNWNAVFRLPEIYKGQRIFVTAKAEWKNGDVTAHRTSFVYQPVQTEGKPALSWVQNLGANVWFTAPVVAEEKVFMATLDEDLKGEGAIIALDAQTGKQLWRYSVRNSVKNRIAYENHTVFAQDAEGYLYAVDAETGSLKWEKKMKVDGLPSIIECVTVADGKLYAGTGKAFGAYDIQTGEAIWLNEGWGQNQGATSCPVLAGDVAVTGTQWSGLYGNDRNTGKLLWRKEESDIRERGASPAYVDGLLYLASGNAFFIIEPKSGNTIIRKEMPYNVNTTSTPLVTDKWIIFGTQNNGLVALDRSTLEQVWQVNTEASLIYTSPYSRYPVCTVESSPILYKGIVYFGASDGVIYGVNPKEGRVVWKYKIGAPLFGKITVAGNSLYAADYSGNVYRFNM